MTALSLTTFHRTLTVGNCLRCNSTVVLPHLPSRNGIPGSDMQSEADETRTTVTGNDDVTARDAAGDAAAREAAREATAAAGQQGLLFDDDVSPLPSGTGYRGPTA